VGGRGAGWRRRNIEKGAWNLCAFLPSHSAVMRRNNLANFESLFYVSVCQLLAVLYGCKIWSLTFRVRVFENMVFRRLFGPKRDEVTGEWRKLHNEELNDLYCSPNTVGMIKTKKN
jgi:uncharacterized membrane protein